MLSYCHTSSCQDLIAYRIIKNSATSLGSLFKLKLIQLLCYIPAYLSSVATINLSILVENPKANVVQRGEGILKRRSSQKQMSSVASIIL